MANGQRSTYKRFLSAVTALLVAAVLVNLAGCAPPSRTQGNAPSGAQAEAPNEYLASRGFYQRRAAGGGWFLDRPAPEFGYSRTLSNLLRIVPGIDAADQTGRVVFSSSRQQRPCQLAVFVDGTYTSIRNVDELTLSDVEALEVYRGPSEVPLTYHPPPYEPTCGAVLVWSRMHLTED